MLRRIKTQEEIAKGRRKIQFLVGGVLVILLVVSTAGFSLMSGDGNSNSNSQTKERGMDFYYENGLWKTVIQEQVFGFRYLPSELANVSINGTYDLGSYSEQVVYFVNPQDGLVEIINNIGGYFTRYQEACLDSEECEGNLPIKECDENVIAFLNGAEDKVYSEERTFL